MIKNCVKKISAIIIIALIVNIMTPYAAIVSDNDGTAFVTKSEFDALKKNFNEQITIYENSIDGKIDGAIAAYLAGMKTGHNIIEKANIAFLGYPLRIVNKVECLENLDNPIRNQASPSFIFQYELTVAAHNGLYSSLAKFLMDPAWYTPDFLNGTWKNENKFLVTGMTKEPKFKRTNLIAGDTACGGNGTYIENHNFVIVGDYKNFVIWGSEASGLGWLKPDTTRFEHTKRGTEYNDYELLINTADATTSLENVPTLQTIQTYVANGNWAWDSNSDLTYAPSTIGANFADPKAYHLVNNTGNDLKSVTYKYTDVTKLNAIYNFNEASASDVTKMKKYLAAISYGDDHAIYLTNRLKNRMWLNNSNNYGKYKRSWGNRVIDLEHNDYFGILGMVTEGLNIEGPYSAPSDVSYKHDYDNRSACVPSKIYYNFNKVDGTAIEHHMVEGIPLYSFSSDYGNNIERLTITFNLQVDEKYTSNQKYIMFSNEPIATQQYDVSTIKNLDYLKFKSASGGIVSNSNDRIAKLSSGTNKLVITNSDELLKGGNVLYMKIIWDDINEREVTITNTPEVYIEYTS